MNRFKILSRGRITQRGQMNKTELRYREQLLTQEGVVKFWFEPFSLRLSSPESGQPARYTPDFLILMEDGTTYVDDVKGSGLDDNAAIVRIKTAAELYPLWIFRLVKERRKRDGGGFAIKEM